MTKMETKRERTRNTQRHRKMMRAGQRERRGGNRIEEPERSAEPQRACAHKCEPIDFPSVVSTWISI